MTSLGLQVDMFTVYTLVTMILPYLFLRFFGPLMPEPYRVAFVTFGTLLGMGFSVIWPVFEQELGIRQKPTTVRRWKAIGCNSDDGRQWQLEAMAMTMEGRHQVVDINLLITHSHPPPQRPQLQTIPLGAATNFIMLLLHILMWRGRFKVRARRDYLVLLAALVCMGTAYLFQDDLKFCVGPNSLFQGHAVWHSGMALGIGFFYLFLRQEREVRITFFCWPRLIPYSPVEARETSNSPLPSPAQVPGSRSNSFGWRERGSSSTRKGGLELMTRESSASV